MIKSLKKEISSSESDKAIASDIHNSIYLSPFLMEMAVMFNAKYWHGARAYYLGFRRKYFLHHGKKIKRLIKTVHFLTFLEKYSTCNKDTYSFMKIST